MSDLSKALADKALQASVRQMLGERPEFWVKHDLPRFLQDKLEALDLVSAAVPKP